MSDSKPESIHDDSRRIAGWMLTLMWLLILGGGTWLAQSWLDSRQNARAPGLSVGPGGEQVLVLQADRFGQFLAPGSINGKSVDFLIDTGASGISLPAAIAPALMASRGRPFEIMTANGRRRVYRTTLDSLSIGPFMQQDVRAHINPGLEGRTVLLGMEFLRHYELLHRDGTLSISQPDSRSR